MEQQRHSGVGIASFITSIASGLFMFLLVIVAGVMDASGSMDKNESAAIIVGLLLFAFMGLAMVALGLGIAGLTQKNRKKIFSLLGTIFSSMTLVLTALVMAA